MELGLLLPVGQRLHGAEPIHDVVRVAEVDLVERAPSNGVSLRGNNSSMCNLADVLPDFVLHVLDHSSDVGYMRGRLADGGVLLSLKRAKNDIVFRHHTTKYDPT